MSIISLEWTLRIINMNLLVFPDGFKALLICGKHSLVLVYRWSPEQQMIRLTSITDMKTSIFSYGPISQVNIDSWEWRTRCLQSLMPRSDAQQFCFKEFLLPRELIKAWCLKMSLQQSARAFAQRHDIGYDIKWTVIWLGKACLSFSLKIITLSSNLLLPNFYSENAQASKESVSSIITFVIASATYIEIHLNRKF